MQTLLCGDELVIVTGDGKGNGLIRLDKLRPSRQLLRRGGVDPRASLAKVQEKILQGELRLHHRNLNHVVAARAERLRKRENLPLIGKESSEGQHRIVGALRNAKLLGTLPRPLPRDTGTRIIALGDVDQLGERVLMLRIDRRYFTGRNRMRCAVRGCLGGRSQSGALRMARLRSSE